MSFLGKFNDIPIIFLLLVCTIILDTSNPTVNKWIKIVFYSIHAMNVLAIALVYLDILSKKDKTKLVYKKIINTFGTTSDDGNEEIVSTTVRDYDNEQNMVLLRSSLIVVIGMTLLNIFFGWTRQFILQVYFPIKLLYVHPLVRIHIFQLEAKRQLARPWNIYSKIPFSTFGGVIKEVEVTPRIIKQQQKQQKKEIKKRK